MRVERLYVLSKAETCFGEHTWDLRDYRKIVCGVTAIYLTTKLGRKEVISLKICATPTTCVSAQYTHQVIYENGVRLKQEPFNLSKVGVRLGFYLLLVQLCSFSYY